MRDFGDVRIDPIIIHVGGRSRFDQHRFDIAMCAAFAFMSGAFVASHQAVWAAACAALAAFNGLRAWRGSREGDGHA